MLCQMWNDASFRNYMFVTLKQWRPEKMNQMTNRQENTIAPSSGEPPALPWHRNGEADDLVGDPGPGQVHPQLESVAESHPQFTNFLQPQVIVESKFLVEWVDPLFTFRNQRLICSRATEPFVWCVQLFTPQWSALDWSMARRSTGGRFASGQASDYSLKFTQKSSFLLESKLKSNCPFF